MSKGAIQKLGVALLLALALACNAGDLSTPPKPPDPITIERTFSPGKKARERDMSSAATGDMQSSDVCSIKCEGRSCELSLTLPTPIDVSVEVLPSGADPDAFWGIEVCHPTFHEAAPDEADLCEKVEDDDIDKPISFQVWPGSEVYALHDAKKQFVWRAPEQPSQEKVQLQVKLEGYEKEPEYQVQGNVLIGGQPLVKYWADRPGQIHAIDLQFRRQHHTSNDSDIVKTVVLREGTSEGYSVGLPMGRWDVFVGNERHRPQREKRMHLNGFVLLEKGLNVLEDTNFDVDLGGTATLKASMTLNGKPLEYGDFRTVLLERFHDENDHHDVLREKYDRYKKGDKSWAWEVWQGTWDVFMAVPLENDDPIFQMPNPKVLAAQQIDLFGKDAKEIQVNAKSFNISIQFLMNGEPVSLTTKSGPTIHGKLWVEPDHSNVQENDAVDIQTYYFNSILPRLREEELSVNMAATTGSVMLNVFWANENSSIYRQEHLVMNQRLEDDLEFTIDFAKTPSQRPVEIQLAGQPLQEISALQDAKLTLEFDGKSDLTLRGVSVSSPLIEDLPLHIGVYDVRATINDTTWSVDGWFSGSGVLSFERPHISVTAAVNWGGLSPIEEKSGTLTFVKMNVLDPTRHIQSMDLFQEDTKPAQLAPGAYDVWFTSRDPNSPKGAVKLARCVEF